jgi:nitrogenase-associated protein
MSGIFMTVMSELVFYEKPGCIGNARQKGVLLSQAVRFEVRDLLSEPWNAERLRPFFADKPVAAWFNETAPAVKSGAIAIHDLDETEALSLMILDPILIRRPLLEYGSFKQSGFVAGPVLDALGVELDATEDLQTCPMTDTETICEAPG